MMKTPQATNAITVSALEKLAAMLLDIEQRQKLTKPKASSASQRTRQAVGDFFS